SSTLFLLVLSLLPTQSNVPLTFVFFCLTIRLNNIIKITGITIGTSTIPTIATANKYINNLINKDSVNATLLISSWLPPFLQLQLIFFILNLSIFGQKETIT